ncbi:DUF6252 family protein [Flavobacterium sp. LS1R49]|uniref:DUF6252 family protein n=1 Tax=Flavobacterium shii TaxID=2987687 RepID=A0A9X3C736_9FLAO|nr:DUF6252 family protein [Flavobacterium shii]MCV9930597.1 DUF6252 family protein [Flavobacterium shii]
MIKRFFLLPLLLLLFSCDKEGVVSNNPAFQSLKNEVFWRAANYSASIDSVGKLTIIGSLNYDKVILQTASVNVKTYTLGIDDVSTATYVNTLPKQETIYKTGTQIGNGQIIITEYNKVAHTVSGTFAFVAPNNVDVFAVDKSIRFKEGVFYKVPITLVNSSN